MTPEEPEPTPEMIMEMGRRFAEAQANAEIRVGWIHHLKPHVEYGRRGALLRLSLLDEQANVTAVDMWVPPDGFDDLRRVFRTLSGASFRASANKNRERRTDKKRRRP